MDEVEVAVEDGEEMIIEEDTEVDIINKWMMVVGEIMEEIRIKGEAVKVEDIKEIEETEEITMEEIKTTSITEIVEEGVVDKDFSEITEEEVAKEDTPTM